LNVAAAAAAAEAINIIPLSSRRARGGEVAVVVPLKAPFAYLWLTAMESGEQTNKHKSSISMSHQLTRALATELTFELRCCYYC
jgi:hypothetical protein